MVSHVFDTRKTKHIQYVLVLERHGVGLEKIQFIKERIYIIYIHNNDQNVIIHIKF